MMTIAGQLDKILNKIPPHIKLVAVSKTQANTLVVEAYEAGQRVFGENKAQELITKQPHLPNDIQWHFIGHLQSNKVKQLAPFVAMIESVDSLKLLKEINKQADKCNRVIDCLLQFHIAEEDTKYGLDQNEVQELLQSETFAKLKHIRICGVMGMATFTENMEQVRREFKQLKAIFDQLKSNHFKNDDYFKEISMGMSGDYLIAIEEGATIIRIGSLIFGERHYS